MTVKMSFDFLWGVIPIYGLLLAATIWTLLWMRKAAKLSIIGFLEEGEEPSADARKEMLRYDWRLFIFILTLALTGAATAALFTYVGEYDGHFLTKFIKHHLPVSLSHYLSH